MGTCQNTLVQSWFFGGFVCCIKVHRWKENVVMEMADSTQRRASQHVACLDRIKAAFGLGL
jgi:hypothetical protein